MVATRRGARTDRVEESDTQEANLALRKKPVRRATAATAATAAKTSQPAPKTRTTRSRKTEDDQEDELAGLPDAQKAPEDSKPVPKRATRSKRGETVEPDSAQDTESARPAAQPKRATRTATVKTSETVSKARAAPATTTDKTLAARPARQTRARAPATQSPLSPKKITQISKSRTRGAKTSDETTKPLPRSRPAATRPASRTTRKRGVSDENADVPDLAPVQEKSVAAEPVKDTRAYKESPVKVKRSDEEEPMSTRDTTPSNSPGPVFEQPKDYTEDRIDAADSEQTDDEIEVEASTSSDDELCGPKTPMKRTRKAQVDRRISTQDTAPAHDPEVPVQTPPRRRGARGVTPQTQKPFAQPTTCESIARPMTVARADNRSFVFRKLQEDNMSVAEPAAMLIATDHVNYDAESQDVESEEHGQGEMEDIEMADTQDETTSHDGRDQQPSDPDETIVLDHDMIDEGENLESGDSPMPQPPEFMHEDMESVGDEEESLIEPQVLDSRDDDDTSLIEPPIAKYNDEDEMLDLSSPTADPPVASYDVAPDGSVIIHSRIGSDSGDENGAAVHNSPGLCLETPRPQTIPWQNLREDVTIPIDFDLHFADARSPARVQDVNAFDVTSHLHDLHSQGINGSLESEQEFGNVAQDQTVNLNEFVDMAALSEPTSQLDAAAGASQDETREVFDGESPSELVEDHEDTVIITKSMSPVSTASDLVERSSDTRDIPIASDKPRSGSMRESLQQLVEMNRNTEANINLLSHDESDVLEEVDDPVPHYALSTLSSRRKSLPALGARTPVKSSTRPTTSDGSSIARVVRPFDQSWWTRSDHASTDVTGHPATPSRSVSGRRPSSARKPAGTSEQHSYATPTTRSGERFPRRTPKANYDVPSAAQTIAAPARHRTPSHTSVKRPATVQRLTSQRGQQPQGTGPSVTSTPATAPKSLADGGAVQAKSFAVPFRHRTPASTPTHNPVTEQRPGTSSTADAMPLTTPKERFPRRSARTTYEQQASTVAPPARFHTPIQGKPRRPATVQRLASQPKHEAPSPQRGTPKQGFHESKEPSTAAAVTPKATPQARFPRLPPKEAYQEHVGSAAMPPPATPQARFPRLPPQQTYDERANTVVGPSRFRSPAHASPRRPATSQKPVNLRKVALKSAAPSGPHTPMKTPLKGSAETPGQVPMTPHPGAPLRGVLALVEVFTLDGASASAPFVSLLQRLGARTTKSWSERVTHVIFKDGSPTTLQRVRLNNKAVESGGKGFTIHCVNSRWVSDCDASGSRVDEDDDAYAVDVTEVPRGGNRRRKSMEPSALINVGGNIVRDRKSVGRQSIGRSAMRTSSAEQTPGADLQFTPVPKFEDLQGENDYDDESELATPDYLDAPDKLVQMTAPMNRVRKLDLQKDASKNRRMTSFWEGGD